MNDKIEFKVKGSMDVIISMTSIELFEKLIRSLDCNALLEDDYKQKYWYYMDGDEVTLRHVGSDEIYDDRGELYLALQTLGSLIVPNWENRR